LLLFSALQQIRFVGKFFLFWELNAKDLCQIPELLFDFNPVFCHISLDFPNFRVKLPYQNISRKNLTNPSGLQINLGLSFFGFLASKF